MRFRCLGRRIIRLYFFALIFFFVINEVVIVDEIIFVFGRRRLG